MEASFVRKVLLVADCNFGCEGISRLASALQVNKTLEALPRLHEEGKGCVPPAWQRSQNPSPAQKVKLEFPGESPGVLADPPKRVENEAPEPKKGDS